MLMSRHLVRTQVKCLQTCHSISRHLVRNNVRCLQTSCSVSQDEVTRAFLSPSKDKLGVQWTDGHVSEFAAVWVRDNCTDPRITDPTSFGRLLLMSDLDTEITIEKVSD